MGFAVEHILGIESSFLGMALMLGLSLIAILPFSVPLRRFLHPSSEDSIRQKVALLASPTDRRVTICWFAVVHLVTFGIAWLVAAWLQIDLLAAVVCMMLIQLPCPDPHELVFSLGGSDPRSLPEPTPADWDAVQRSTEKGLLWLAVGTLHVLFAFILLLLIVAYFRS